MTHLSDRRLLSLLFCVFVILLQGVPIQAQVGECSGCQPWMEQAVKVRPESWEAHRVLFREAWGLDFVAGSSGILMERTRTPRTWNVFPTMEDAVVGLGGEYKVAGGFFFDNLTPNFAAITPFRRFEGVFGTLSVGGGTSFYIYGTLATFAISEDPEFRSRTEGKSVFGLLGIADSLQDARKRVKAIAGGTASVEDDLFDQEESLFGLTDGEPGECEPQWIANCDAFYSQDVQLCGNTRNSCVITALAIQTACSAACMLLPHPGELPCLAGCAALAAAQVNE